MRKEYGKALRHLFKQQLKKNNIDLVEYKPSSEYRVPGDRVYKSEIGSLGCFVILIPHHIAEKFTLEIGWSESNSFPAVKIRPSGFLSPNRKEFNNTDFVIRIGDLLGRSDFWWTVEEAPLSVNDILQSMEKMIKEKAEAKVLPHVEDAIQKIIHNVSPFFEELAAYKAKK